MTSAYEDLITAHRKMNDTFCRTDLPPARPQRSLDTLPPPPSSHTAQSLHARAAELRTIAHQLLARAAELDQVAERL